MPRLLTALGLLLLLAPTAPAQRFQPTTSPTSPAGTRSVVDLPTSKHLRNTGGSDGLGLCVFTSIWHSAQWQNVTVLDGYRRWMERRPGGGYPSKVDQTLAAYCREIGVPVPAYAQHTGGDDTFLDLAIRTDRCPAVTYDGRDDFYRGAVAHMVNLVHLDSAKAAILDNNRPGVWLWMTRADFLSRWRGNSGGWAVVLLDPPPPPYTTAPTHAVLEHHWVGTTPAGCRCEPCDCERCECDSGIPEFRNPKVFGQNCANGRCVPPRRPLAPSPAPQPSPDEPSPILASGPPPIGTAPTAAHEWGPFPDGRWGWRFKVVGAPAPAAAPVAPPVVGQDVPPGGVDVARVHEGPEYSISGRPASRDEVHAAVGAGNLLDDTDHWHLTAVGDVALCAKVRADVAALPADLRGKLLVQCYPWGTWPIDQFKLAQGLCLRAPSPGRVATEVGRLGEAEYIAGVSKLADLLGLPGGPAPRPTPPPAPTPPAPSPSPDPAPPAPVPSPIPVPTPGVPWWVVALGALLLILRRK